MERLYNRKEAAEYLGIHTNTLDQIRAEGKIGYIQRKKRGRVLFREQDLVDYVRRITRPAVPERMVRETYRTRRA